MLNTQQYLQNLEYLVKQNHLLEIPDENDLQTLLYISHESGISVDTLLFKNMEMQDAIKNSGLKMLVMDCDGVLTDGGMTFTKNGDEIKRFNAKDGQGIKNAMQAGMKTGIISAGISTGLVEKRAEMLGIEHCYVGKSPKLEILTEWSEKLGIELSEMAYIGDDVTDIAIMQNVGASFCPADAVWKVKLEADVILSAKGGEGCVRELVENYLLPH